MLKRHPRLTLELLLEAAERRDHSLDNPGFCVKCGEEQDGCEPDARAYKCEHCGERAVYAPEELLMGII